MKKKLFLSLILLGTLGFAQTNCDNLKTENQSLKTENEYLKKVLEINTPIFETTKDDTSYKITSVTGNSKDNSILVNVLSEAKDVSKEFSSQDIVIVDLEGNIYKVDLFKSTNSNVRLIENTPIKLTFGFKEIPNKIPIIKAFTFISRLVYDGKPLSPVKATHLFKDLKVNWQ